MRVANHDRAIDGLRGLALLVIVTTHFVPPRYFSFSISKPTSAVLFAVAGYFLMAVLVKNAAALDGPWRTRVRTMWHLLFMRHLRIWPVLAIVIGLYALLGLAFPDRITTQVWGTWPLYLSYLGNIPKILYGGQAFPAQFWVVSTQEQMIFMFALLIMGIGLTKANRFLPALVVIGIVGRAIMTSLFVTQNPALALETPFSAVDALAMGMMARLAIEQRIGRRGLRRAAVTAMILVGLLWAILPDAWSFYFTLTPLAVAFASVALILTLTDPLRSHRLQDAIFTYPPFVLLGQMSLTLFFTHPLVATLFRLSWTRYVGIPLEWWERAIAGPILALIFAFGFFRFIEVPIRQWRKRHDPAPDKRPAAPAVERADSPIVLVKGS